MIHAFSVLNLIPTKNKQSVIVPVPTGWLLYVIGQKKKVNIGQFIFDNPASLAGVESPKFSIGNPSLLYELVMIQAPKVKLATKRVACDLQRFYADHKLFNGEHFVDVKRAESEEERLNLNLLHHCGNSICATYSQGCRIPRTTSFKSRAKQTKVAKLNWC